jgi:hypothetical protein
MATRKVLAYRCDAPSCFVERIGTPDEPALGYHLTAQVVHGTGGLTVDVFACSSEHVQDAVTAVVKEES